VSHRCESRSWGGARRGRESWQSLGKVPLLWSQTVSRRQTCAKAARGTTRVLWSSCVFDKFFLRLKNFERFPNQDHLLKLCAKSLAIRWGPLSDCFTQDLQLGVYNVLFCDGFVELPSITKRKTFSSSDMGPISSSRCLATSNDRQRVESCIDCIEALDIN
jgi:hypothetical protein